MLPLVKVKVRELNETDVLIIGAGITGISLARELAKYDVDVTVTEREADVAMGISKTSGSLVYMGLFQQVAASRRSGRGRR